MAAKRSSLTRAAALVAAAALMGAGLSGCGLGRALGISKTSPDEFAVVTKAPLVLPPDYELRPPKPGAKRPQELEPSEAAKQALFKNQFGQSGAAPSTGEQALLTSAGANQANADTQAGKDNKLLVRKSEDFANKLLFGDENAIPATPASARTESVGTAGEESAGPVEEMDSLAVDAASEPASGPEASAEDTDETADETGEADDAEATEEPADGTDQ